MVGFINLKNNIIFSTTKKFQNFFLIEKMLIRRFQIIRHRVCNLRKIKISKSKPENKFQKKRETFAHFESKGATVVNNFFLKTSQASSSLLQILFKKNKKSFVKNCLMSIFKIKRTTDKVNFSIKFNFFLKFQTTFNEIYEKLVWWPEEKILGKFCPFWSN